MSSLKALANANAGVNERPYKDDGSCQESSAIMVWGFFDEKNIRSSPTDNQSYKGPRSSISKPKR